jgi:predicted dehydrogenase
MAAKKGDEVLNQFTQKKEAVKIDASGKKIKIGIIGTGWIAEAHIESYKQMPDVEIVAAADLVEGKAQKFMERYGLTNVRFYPDHKAMLDNEELDAVSVCTYNSTHAECTIYALNKGVHVLLEKPMCVTTEEAAEIIKAEKKSGKLLSIGFQPRFDENMSVKKL